MQLTTETTKNKYSYVTEADTEMFERRALRTYKDLADCNERFVATYWLGPPHAEHQENSELDFFLHGYIRDITIEYLDTLGELKFDGEGNIADESWDWITEVEEEAFERDVTDLLNDVDTFFTTSRLFYISEEYHGYMEAVNRPTKEVW